MLKKINIIKLLSLIAIIFFSLGFYNIADEPAIEIHPNHANFYQERPCSYSIFELLSQDRGTYKIELISSPNGEIECFGKNSWFVYQPEKLIENGWNEYEEAKIKIWLFTNPNLDVLIQTFFWLIILSFIPKSKVKTIKNKYLISFIISLLFYLHIFGEKDFYKSISRDFDLEIFSREYSGELYFENYYLFSFLISLFFITFIFLKISEYRFENFINYSPFIFLIFGTYSSLNLNFYTLLFCTVGLVAIFNKKINLNITLGYIIFSIFWFINLNSKDINFDVDKVRGFLNSSQTYVSLIYWVVVYYLIISGIYFLITETKENFKINVFNRNLLITSSLVFLFGLFSAMNKLFNYISFYFLGLNKFGMRSLESIEGNTWRGIAPSAEAMGEFFAFVLLFTLLVSIKNKKFPNIINSGLLIITLFGLFRTNNFAAISSSIVIILFFIILNNLKSPKKSIINIGIALLILSLLSGLLYTKFFQEYSYEELSNSLLYKGLQASELNYNFSLNEFGKTQAQQANYQFVLNIPKESANLSSSLRFLIENYNNGYNIKYLPSAVSLLNVTSFFINRSEKWGIFFSKYNPDLKEFVFGYGPQQFTEYYFGHYTKYNYGLYLPHSSVLNYLLFFGIIGVLIFTLIILNKFKKNPNCLISKSLIIFMLLNIIKSDSLLYLPNLILFVIVFNFFELYESNKQDI